MEGTRAPVGLMGKHPGYGDFLQWGLAQATIDAWTQWCDAVLPPLRDATGDNWGGFWDHAQDLRFWVGRAVLGQTLVGVLRPSRDKVGRRFPLIVLCEGAAVAAPLSDPDQAPWEEIVSHMDQMQAGQGASALMDGATIAIAAEDEALARVGPTLWAHHPGGDLSALLSSAAEVDLYRAQLSRSYWWATGDADRAPVWLGCAGLPDSAALGWLLAGVAQERAE